jgi:arylsulfatase
MDFRMAIYAAQVDRMDENVGKIVAALKTQKQLDNTLILFLSDNGGCAEGGMLGGGTAASLGGHNGYLLSYGKAWAGVSNTPFRFYKHFVHEGGISTPLIAHWPAGIARKGQFEAQPGHLIDVMATCVDVAGADYPKEQAGQAVPPLEGRSLVPAFAGKPIEREALFWEHEGNRALRVGAYKLVARRPQGDWELYDMTKDRTEVHNLAAAEPERVKTMAATWDSWAKRTHAIPWPWDGPNRAKDLPEKAKGKGKQAEPDTE